MGIGPVDVVIIGFPGNKFTGRIAPALMELVDSGTIRIIDLLFVMKDADGVMTTIDVAGPRSGHGAGASWRSRCTEPGALGPEDAEEVADDLEPNTSALLIAFENTWAAKFVDAVPRGGRRADRPDPHPRRRGRSGPRPAASDPTPFTDRED